MKAFKFKFVIKEEVVFAVKKIVIRAVQMKYIGMTLLKLEVWIG